MSLRVRLALAGLCLAAGVVLILLATDVVRWQGRIGTDDQRFAAVPERGDLWTLPELVPGGAARAVLGADDDLAYRRAVRTFALGAPRRETYTDARRIAYRAKAQVLLSDVFRHSDDPSARAGAANLLGVLAFASAVLDPPQANTYLAAASTSFREAIANEPEQADAKYNLELALRRLQAQGGSNARGGASRGGVGSGSGARRPGSGY